MEELVKLHNRFTSLMEKRVRKAFLDSVKRTTKKSDFAVALDEIRSGKVVYSYGAIYQRLSNIDLDMSAFETVLLDTFIGGGRITAKAFSNSIAKANTPKLNYDFNPSLPDAVAAARTNAATSITQIKKSTRDAIRQMVQDALQDGLAPWELAEQVEQVVGLTGRDAVAVGKYRDAMMQTKSRSAANSAANQYARRLLASRATTIARTETIKASNEGQQAYWSQGVASGDISPATVVKVWIATIPSERTCGICSTMDGKTAPIDSSFTYGGGAYLHPPVHPNCRCTTGLVLNDDIAKYNKNHSPVDGRFTTAQGAMRSPSDPGGKTDKAVYGKLRRTKMGEELLARVQNPDEGFTITASTMKTATKGIAVAIAPTASFHKKVKDTRPEDIDAWIKEHAAELAKPNRCIGGWHDPQTGDLWLDVSMTFSSMKRAKTIAVANNQIAVYDLKTGKSVDTGGTGEVKKSGGGLVLYLFDSNVDGKFILDTIKKEK